MFDIDTFTDEEWELIEKAPVVVFLLVAAADGKIDDKELKMFSKMVSRVLEKDSHELTQGMMGFALVKAGALIPSLINSGNPAGVLQRFTQLLDQKVGEPDATHVKLTLIGLAKKIGEASGGFLGFGKKISKEEEEAIAGITDILNSPTAPPAPELTEEELEAWYEEKSKMMEGVLGKEHDMVRHSLIPFAVGGALHLYYYPNGIEGVAIATKELANTPASGSRNDHFTVYELAMFTRLSLDMDNSNNPDTPFGQAHRTMNSALNAIGAYSAEATLNPNETCEFPEGMEGIGGKCLIFDAYKSSSPEKFGVLAVIEVFRSEMEFARANGGAVLLQKLKDAGCYPYSDMDRAPVA